MTIDKQLQTARTVVMRLALELQNTWSLPQGWFQDMMIQEVFGFLLRGRIKYDTYRRPASFDELWSDVLHADMAVEYNDHGGTGFLFEEFRISLQNLTYVVEECSNQKWSIEPDLGSYTHYFPGYHYISRVRLSSDSVLRFLHEFDGIVPMINTAAGCLFDEMAKNNLINTIMETSLDVLEGSLDAAGIRYCCELRAKDIVIRCKICGHTGIRTRIPAEQYVSRIQELPCLISNPEEGIRKYGKDFRYERLKW